MVLLEAKYLIYEQRVMKHNSPKLTIGVHIVLRIGVGRTLILKNDSIGGGFSQASFIHHETPQDLSYPERYELGLAFDPR